MSQELEDRFFRHQATYKIEWFGRANYIEASDDLGKLDEKLKIKISEEKQKNPCIG
jgi:hypothetical protein